MPQALEMDESFATHFRNLHQVFMYITDRCNLECEHCIYKPSISHFINEEIELETALDLLHTFRKLGAAKATFLGGEPTVYGHRKGGKPLLDLIRGTRELGYEYVGKCVVKLASTLDNPIQLGLRDVRQAGA